MMEIEAYPYQQLVTQPLRTRSDIDPAKRGGWPLSIRYLEKPKGCLGILRLLTEQKDITISDILTRTALSQSCAYSSLNRLAELDLVELSTKFSTRGTPKRYKLTPKGEKLLLPLSVFFDTLKFALEDGDACPHLVVPHRNLEVLVLLHEKGHVSHAELVQKEGMCKTTARATLQVLKNLGLLCMEVKRDFRRTTKEYSLTEKGQRVARALCILVENLRLLLNRK
jgi:predicted ArsR family transcriptional regulator